MQKNILFFLQYCMKIIVIVDQNGTQKEQPINHIREGYHRNNFMSLSLKLKDFDSMNILYIWSLP